MGIWAGEDFVGHQKIDPEPADDRPFGLSLKKEENLKEAKKPNPQKPKLYCVALALIPLLRRDSIWGRRGKPKVASCLLGCGRGIYCGGLGFGGLTTGSYVGLAFTLGRWEWRTIFF